MKQVEVSLKYCYAQMPSGVVDLETLVAEGSTLEEAIDNATVSTVTQDGGEGRLYRLGDLPQELCQYAEKKIVEKWEEL